MKTANQTLSPNGQKDFPDFHSQKKKIFSLDENNQLTQRQEKC